MAVSVRRLAETFVGEVSGVDLARLDGAATDAIKNAWLAHKVLVFHDQHLDEDNLVAFAEHLGDVEIHLRQTRTTGRREVMLVSNIKEDGKAIGRLGNQELNWHMDQIFMAQPTAGTILYAVEVTPEGGDTWFCDLGAAYEMLPPGLKAKVDGRRAVHSAATADRRVGIQLSADQKARAPEVIHPLVRTHPLAHEKGLYFSMNHTARLDGLSEEDSLPLLDKLRAHATQPRFVYAHRWQVGDLVLWDNACTMHRRDPFPDEYPRLMRRVGINFPADLRVPF
ncbi:MAG TPA: TauD/TfdA family dioxygenase [Stellaceae bacterium]|jgi:taurine dioxygenase|nr:TauD/TfdA family dioxygenase [Stellaceae bacterium]